MQLGKLQIPKINTESLSFVEDVQTRLFFQYFNIVEKTEIGKEVAEKISNDPRVKALEGKMISRGSSAHSFDAKNLTMWFLWCANEYGPESAEEYLNSFLDDNVVPVMNTLWVLGIEVAEPIQLKDGFEILPIERLPDSREKEMFLQSRFDFGVPLKPYPVSAITYPCKINKTRSSDNPISDDEDREFWQSSSRLYDIAWLLNALDGISCLPYSSTSYTYPTTPFGPFGGSGSGYPIYDVLGNSMSNLTTNDQPIIEELIQSYDKLPDSEKTRFQIILDRLSQAKRRNKIEDKILDLGIALEMLLLSKDNKTNDQLSQSFRLRGSWLLGRTEQDRKTIFKQFRDIYDYRSQVAHSGILCGGDSRKIQDVREAFPKYQSLAEQVCRFILKNGDPQNWNDIILGIGLPEMR